MFQNLLTNRYAHDILSLRTTCFSMRGFNYGEFAIIKSETWRSEDAEADSKGHRNQYNQSEWRGLYLNYSFRI